MIPEGHSGTPVTAPLIRHLQILRTVTDAVSRSLNLNEVLQKSVAALTHVTGHEIASLHLISADGQNLLLRGDRGLSDLLMRETVERMKTTGPHAEAVELRGIGHAPTLMHADQIAIVRDYLLRG